MLITFCGFVDNFYIDIKIW